MAHHSRFEYKKNWTAFPVRSTSSGRSCNRMVSMANESVGHGWRSKRSYDQILEYQQWPSHQFNWRKITSVRHTMVENVSHHRVEIYANRSKSKTHCILHSIYRYRELISAHSHPDFQLTIWKYPSLRTICELKGHEHRILHMAMSPDGSTVISLSADETIRIWKCFAPDERQANMKKSAMKIQPSLLRPNIRWGAHTFSSWCCFNDLHPFTICPIANHARKRDQLCFCIIFVAIVT